MADRALQPALTAGSVVTYDQKYGRVIGMTAGFQVIEQTTYFMVRFREICCIQFRLRSIQPLLVGTQRIPSRQFLGPRGKIRSGGNDAQGFLPGKRGLTLFVPAQIELTFELADPIPRHMV